MRQMAIGKVLLIGILAGLIIYERRIFIFLKIHKMMIICTKNAINTNLICNKKRCNSLCTFQFRIYSN